MFVHFAVVPESTEGPWKLYVGESVVEYDGKNNLTVEVDVEPRVESLSVSRELLLAISETCLKAAKGKKHTDGQDK